MGWQIDSKNHKASDRLEKEKLSICYNKLQPTSIYMYNVSIKRKDWAVTSYGSHFASQLIAMQIGC